MVHQAAFAFVDEFDRVLDGDDMVVTVLIRVVEHRREGRGLAGTGRTGHHHQAALQHGKFLQHRRQRRFHLVEVFKRKDLAGNLAKHRPDAVLLVEKVRAKARHIGNFVAEIDVARFLE